MTFHAVVVDDEELAVQGLSVFPWESYGIELAATFTDPRQALAWIKANPVDIVLADIRMPGLSGLDLAAAIRDSVPDVLVILFSGHSEFTYAQEALRHGVFRYVLKPVDDEELGVALQDACRVLCEQERRKHWTQQIARDYWFRERLLDRRVDKDAEELTVAGNLDGTPHRYVVFVITTERDLFAMVGGATGVRQCTTLRSGEWAVLIGAEARDAFGDWLERNHLLSGASASHSGMVEIRQGFLEARRAAGMHFLWPDRCVIRFEEIPQADHDAVSTDLVEANRLAACVTLLEDEECAESVRSLFCRFVRHAATPEVIRRAGFILAVGAQSALREVGSSVADEELSSVPDMFELSSQATSVEDLVRKILSALRAAHRLIVDMRSRERSDEQLSRALGFIHASYHKLISLDDVAEHMNMHPSTFSVWFKKKKGANYIDYLTSYRIETAKQLLRCPDALIREVAAKVGFQDPRYFGQVFKRYVGVTPGRYQLLYGSDATDERACSETPEV